jgi:hypothetical protein
MAFSLMTLAIIRFLCRWWAALQAEAAQMWIAHQQYLDDVCDQMLGISKEEEEEEEKPIAAPRYEDKYLDKLALVRKNGVGAGGVGSESTDYERLINNWIIESTPVGNVAMRYDAKRESFVYRCDHVAPFRILEVVSRKYALTYGCVGLLVDMQAELDRAAAAAEAAKLQTLNPLYAQFKAKKAVVKDKTNRYTHEGRFAGFNFLQKVPRQAVDKRAALSFADFKRKRKEQETGEAIDAAAFSE